MILPEQVTTLFDLSQFAHADIFDGIAAPWDVLGRIERYCESHADNTHGSAVGNYIVVKGNVQIGEGTNIHAFVTIEGPVIIGNHCEIRPGAYIRGPAIIGDHCVVGHGSEIKNAILLDGAQAPHRNYVGDSVLGNKVNLGGGTQLSNLRFDDSEICVRVSNRRIPTGRRKFGALIGDGVKTGANAVILPGTLVGRGVQIFPLVTVGGFIEEGSIVKTSTYNVAPPPSDRRSKAGLVAAAL